MIKKFKHDPRFIYQKNFNRLLVCLREYDSPSMQEFLHDPDLLLNSSKEKFYKKTPGDTTTVGVVVLAGRKFLVKRYNVKNFFHRLKVSLRGTRAARAWFYAYHLLDLDIPTVQPIALLEKRKGPLRSTGYIISEYLSGMPGCHFFGKEFKPDSSWQNMVHAMFQLIGQLKVAQLSHSDLHVGNMLIVDKQPLLLDLDHMRSHRVNFQRTHQKDIQLFLRYLEHNPSVKNLFQELFTAAGKNYPSKQEKVV